MATDAPSRPEPSLPLRVWLSVFCPVYRRTLAGLVGLNVLSAVGAFIELQMLRAITVALSGPAPAATDRCSVVEWAASGFSLGPKPCGGSLPLFLLGAYTLSTLMQSAFDMIAYTVNSRLVQQARHDVERELLSNLLRQDDAFYIRRSPAEIVSRLGGDLQRISARRQNFTEGSATALAIIATLLVLITQSWLAAAIGLAVSLIGVAAAEPRMRKLRELDRESVLSDERVKSNIEDTLQGAAEIQVSGVLGRMLKRFDALQTIRDAIALRNAGLNNRNMVAQRLTFTLGFIVILAIFIFGGQFVQAGVGTASGSATAGLIVVLISSLPTLYFRFAEITQRLTQFRIADESVRRLVQYEAPPSQRGVARAPPSPVEQPDAIRVIHARYQFSGSEAVQGGPDGLDCRLPARGTTAIVGPAGSGKSTLIKLVLGRQALLSGEIALPADAGRPLFAYLPQRPILFDAPIRDNLFLGDAPPDARSRVLNHDSLARIGLIDLIRVKGLEAKPHGSPSAPDMVAQRAAFRAAAQAVLGSPLRPLGLNACGLRQMAIESQLGCAVDQEAFTRRLATDSARRIVTSLASLGYGKVMADLAFQALSATAPLLAKAGDVDEYNAIATYKLDPSNFMLRRMALEMVAGGDAPPPGPPSPLLVAIGIALRLEELETSAFPAAEAAASAGLAKLADGLSQSLDETSVNPLLPWRENLLFASVDKTNSRDLANVDRALLDRLKQTSLDAEVIEAGFDYAVGRLGARLSGGQQQLVGLGRVLLTDARFLVLDEPSSAFHPQLRQLTAQVLKQEGASRGVIVVTHDLDLARACDRIVFIRDGAIAGQGSFDELVAHADGFAAWAAESGGA